MGYSCAAAISGVEQQMSRDEPSASGLLGEFHAAVKEWKEARDWYGRSLGVWQDWTKWGLSGPFDERRREQSERTVSRYGRLLLTNSPE
ncbi:MAG: hypothetical protein HYZ37_13135 [Candidatus Solibacter usitatus]|nr:hypothetical protein [Candidatus Solibacter usitatus]